MTKSSISKLINTPPTISIAEMNRRTPKRNRTSGTPATRSAARAPRIPKSQRKESLAARPTKRKLVPIANNAKIFPSEAAMGPTFPANPIVAISVVARPVTPRITAVNIAYTAMIIIPAMTMAFLKSAFFKKAIVMAGIIIITVYAIFTAVILGVTGLATTEIATIGLAGKVGPIAASLGNIFALFAMGTSFLLVGLAARDSLRWDFGMRGARASLLVAGVPLGLFLVGVRRFITAIDIVGGVFLSLEMLLLVIIYWRGEKLGGVPPRKQRLH